MPRAAKCEKVYILGPNEVPQEALDYIAKFTEVRLREINLHHQMPAVIVNIEGNPQLCPDQMTHSFNAVEGEVRLTLNSNTLNKLKTPGLSPSLLQSAAAATSTIAITRLIERTGTTELSLEEQKQIFMLEIDRSGRVIEKALREVPDVTGTTMKSSDIYPIKPSDLVF